MKYLLLRDNKQSGPYSKDELVTKGLKPYDLVWLEGKSAAWRYPSEFDELKPFAPVVEEQPYDRFYKKSSAQSSSSNEYLEARSKKQTQTTVTEKEVTVVETPVTPVATPVVPVMEEPVVAKPVTVVPSKKIYVTMPAANGNGYAAAAKKETVIPQPVAKTKEEYKAYEPVPVDEVPVKKEKVTPAVKPVNEVYEQEQPATTQWGDNGSYGQEERITTLRREKKSNKTFMRLLVAACLILGGIVIGLAISNQLSKSDRKDLEALVNQIREREKAREAANKQADNPVENTTTTLPAEDSLAAQDETTQPITDVVAADAKNLNTSKKERNTVPAVDAPKATMPVPVKNTDEEMKISPAVMEDSKEKVTYKEAALESARKNIYSMVDVASNKYKVGVLGGISEFYITLSNNSLYPLDQVSVEVKYFGPEKRVVKTQMLLFNDIAPGEQKTLEVPKTNRGVSVDYSITQINSKVLGLARAK